MSKGAASPNLEFGERGAGPRRGVLSTVQTQMGASYSGVTGTPAGASGNTRDYVKIGVLKITLRCLKT